MQTKICCHYLLLLILLTVDIIAAAEIHTTSATALLSIDQSNHQSIEIESVKVTMTTAIESFQNSIIEKGPLMEVFTEREFGPVTRSKIQNCLQKKEIQNQYWPSSTEDRIFKFQFYSEKFHL